MKTKKINYSPNLADKRVIKRVVKALQFVSACLSDKKPKRWSHSAIEKNFGQNDLGVWLRKKLLRTTNKGYDVNRGVTKEYIFSRKDFNELINEVRSIDKDAMKFFGGQEKEVTEKKTNATMLKMNHGSLNQSTNSPYCSLLLSDEQKLALQYTIEQCGEQLASGNFNLRPSACGRLHTEIQNVDKMSRSLASLSYGYKFEYDVETCYLTLIYQHARSVGLTTNCPRIEHYLENKTERRQYLARLMKGSVKEAKDLLTSIFNGAPFGQNSRWSSFKTVSCRGYVMQWLKDDIWLTELREEIRQMWKAIELVESVVYKEDKNGKKRKQIFNSRRKAAVYFKLERKMLDAIMLHLTETNNTFFPIHDGWVCKNVVDTKELTQVVFEKTGFKIKLDVDELSTKIKEIEMNNVPKNWKTRPRYSKLLSQLDLAAVKFPDEVEFAKESLTNWVEGIPSFFNSFVPPNTCQKLTLEQMEDWLGGDNVNHHGESEFYGSFFADCVNEYIDEFEDDEKLIEMFSFIKFEE